MRSRRWIVPGVVAVLGAAGCEDLIVGTETGNPNPRMGDMEDMMPTMPTSRPVDIVDMPEPVDEPGTNEGGAGSDIPIPSVSGSPPVGNPGGAGPGDGVSPGGTPGIGDPPGGQAGMTTGSTPGVFGGAGATSPNGCQDQCSAQAAASVAPLSQVAPAPAPFDAAECLDGTCRCTTAQGAVTSVSPGGDCALYGRGRNCLISSAELTACNEAIGDSCADTCAAAETALAEDANRVREVTVQSWTCDTGTCGFVVSIDGECFANYGTEPIDCAEGALLGTEVMDSGAP